MLKAQHKSHQIALIVAAIGGLMAGDIIGFALTGHGERFGLWAFWYGYTSFGGFIGSIVGALLGIATAYVTQFLRQ